MSIIRFKPDDVARAAAKMVHEETGAEVLDYLLDVEECAIIDWTDELGHIDIESVCETIDRAAHNYIDFYNDAMKGADRCTESLSTRMSIHSVSGY